ncbi:MAG TPA: hypothetical protein VJW55_09405, partial [Candidatus Angelobacter sp.]|nr:hypothetical protein [Candidatus Angelobacter sp.]
MNKTKTLVLISSLALAFSLSVAQTSTTGKPGTHRPLSPQAKAQINKDAGTTKTALPTTEEVDAYMKRSFGYDPGVSWQIYSI